MKNGSPDNIPEELRDSPYYNALLEAVSKLGPTDLPVLIRGSRGAPKEFVARLLHQFSTRSTGPFLPIRCSLLNRSFLNASLFGGPAKGLLALINGGTLFLDGITVLDANTQSRLLHILQYGTNGPSK